MIMVLLPIEKKNGIKNDYGSITHRKKKLHKHVVSTL